MAKAKAKTEKPKTVEASVKASAEKARLAKLAEADYFGLPKKSYNFLISRALSDRVFYKAAGKGGLYFHAGKTLRPIDNLGPSFYSNVLDVAYGKQWKEISEEAYRITRHRPVEFYRCANCNGFHHVSFDTARCGHDPREVFSAESMEAAAQLHRATGRKRKYYYPPHNVQSILFHLTTYNGKIPEKQAEELRANSAVGCEGVYGITPVQTKALLAWVQRQKIPYFDELGLHSLLDVYRLAIGFKSVKLWVHTQNGAYDRLARIFEDNGKTLKL